LLKTLPQAGRVGPLRALEQQQKMDSVKILALEIFLFNSSEDRKT
jgi:hypothetical protein